MFTTVCIFFAPFFCHFTFATPPILFSFFTIFPFTSPLAFAFPYRYHDYQLIHKISELYLLYSILDSPLNTSYWLYFSFAILWPSLLIIPRVLFIFSNYGFFWNGFFYIKRYLANFILHGFFWKISDNSGIGQSRRYHPPELQDL